MKIVTQSIILLLATVATATPTSDLLSLDWTNAGKCAAKGANINAAIDSFCTNSDIVVPSSYAMAGKVHGDVLVHIGSRRVVDASCSSVAQWVPAEWCRAQFHAICAGSQGGFGGRGYGTGKCQWFEIKHLTGKGKGKGKGKWKGKGKGY